MDKQKILKSIIAALFIFIFVNAANANSYIIISPYNISRVESESSSFLNFHLLSTLDNTKRSVIVTPYKDGEGCFAIRSKNSRKCDYKAYVKDGVLEIKGDTSLKVLPIDVPPELMEPEAK